VSAEDFVKLSVRYRTDMRLAGVSDAAELAFLRGLAYCGLNVTHGLIPREDLPQLGPRKVAEELVNAGFWTCVPQGWAYTAWDKWQGEFETVLARRKRDAARKREYRLQQRAQEGETP